MAVMYFGGAKYERIKSAVGKFPVKSGGIPTALFIIETMIYFVRTSAPFSVISTMYSIWAERPSSIV